MNPLEDVPPPAPNLMKSSWSITYIQAVMAQAYRDPSEQLVMSSQAHRPFCSAKLTLSGL